jgi:uncharacterized protein
MAAIPPEVQRFVRQARLGFVATVSPDGTANLSPKGTTTVWDDSRLVFADLRSPNTVRNLKLNPSIEVNVVDVFSRRGYRFKGVGHVHSDGPWYEEGLDVLAADGFDLSAERVRSIVIIEIEWLGELLSPAYDLGADEHGLRLRWQQHYLSDS